MDKTIFCRSDQLALSEESYPKIEQLLPIHLIEVVRLIHYLTSDDISPRSFLCFDGSKSINGRGALATVRQLYSC